jgi:hypothetical protein
MILGLSGRAGAGKDLTYKLLVELADMLIPAGGRMSVVRRAFADPLKVSAARALGFDGEPQECIDFCNRLKTDGEITVSSRVDDEWMTWFAGLVDGEGCFRLTTKGFPEFSMGLRADDRGVLEDIVDSVGFGHLYEYTPPSGNPIVYYKVAKRDDCRRLASLLDGRLRSKKIRDFETWKFAIDAVDLGANKNERLRLKAKISEERAYGSETPIPAPPKNRLVFSGRQYLQWYGTEAHREVFADSFWVDATLPLGWNPVNELVVITDCRFANEAERIHQNGGVVWYIDRPDLAQIAESAHISETRLDDKWLHRVIHNDGDIDVLRHRIGEGLAHFDSDLGLDVPCNCD